MSITRNLANLSVEFQNDSVTAVGNTGTNDLSQKQHLDVVDGKALAAQTDATNAQTAATNAQTAATNAQTDATAALNQIAALPKQASFSVTSGADALFSVDISSAGFTSVNSVSAVAVKAGTTAQNAPLVSLQTVSTAAVSGLTVESNSVEGLQALTQGLTESPSVQVFLTVFGS